MLFYFVYIPHWYSIWVAALTFDERDCVFSIRFIAFNYNINFFIHSLECSPIDQSPAVSKTHIKHTGAMEVITCTGA